MKYQAILFDMDGTLVPMDTNGFVKGYLKMLYAKLAKYGLDPKKFTDGMWAGVGAMVQNDGSRTNEAAFWDVFEQINGIGQAALNDDCLAFYGNEFHQAKMFTEENPLAIRAVEIARQKADHVALATNPLFPMVAQVTRMRWVGLEPDDFELVTAFEEDRYCKPNPVYFLEVCRRLDVEPQNCLMIGNDENEDMYAANQVGMDCFLVTDYMIPSEEHPWNGRRGSFAQLVEFLEQDD